MTERKRAHPRPKGNEAPHYLSDEPLTLRGFDTAADLEAFYRAQPHRLYAGVVFPRFTQGGGGGGGAVVQWNGSGWFEVEGSDDAILVDERFRVMMNGSYVPGADVQRAPRGDECRPLYAADGATYKVGRDMASYARAYLNSRCFFFSPHFFVFSPL